MKLNWSALVFSLALTVMIFCEPQQAAAGFQRVFDNSTELPTISLVSKARHSIDIEIYEMGDPFFRQALRSALARHVRIRIVKEPTPFVNLVPGKPDRTCYYFKAPQTTDSPDCLDQKRLLAQIVQAGGAVAPYNKEFCPAWSQARCFEHGKMIVIDAGMSTQMALISTGNFNVDNFCDIRANAAICNRDYTVVTTDPSVVGSLENIFQGDLAGKPYDPRTVIYPHARNTLTVSPFSEQPLVDFIHSAKKYVLIQNQYLHQKNINQALLDVAKAGVKVFVNVSSLCAFGPPSPESMDPTKPGSNAAIFTAFDQAGIQTRMFTGTQTIRGKFGYLHAKAIVVDGIAAWVGSVNGSMSATSANREFGIFFNDRPNISHLEAIMRYDFNDPRGETWMESSKCLRDPPRPNGESD